MTEINKVIKGPEKIFILKDIEYELWKIFTWERDWILLYRKLLPIVLLCCYIYRWLKSLKLTWNIHKHTTVVCTFQNNSCAFALLLDAQGCKKMCYSKWRMFWRTFSSFQAFWDNPREVVIIQLWLVVNGWNIMMSFLSLCSFTGMFSRTFFLCKTIFSSFFKNTWCNNPTVILC